MTDALVLAGAVAKGAFTAGALAALFEPATQERLELDVRRVVAASSGAMNGAFLASHLHDGSEAAAMPLLEELWTEFGDFRDVFDVSFGALAHGRGISTGKKVRALLERFIPPREGTRPTELAVVVTNMSGEVDTVGSERATTYERCLRFSGEAFESSERLSSVFDAVVASSAFPFLFEPASITIGAREVPCVDGGVCNNTPIKYALGGGSDVDRIFVVAPYPSVQTNAPEFHGVALFSHLGEMLAQERYLELRVIRRSRRLARGSRGGRRDALRITAPPYNEARKSSRLLFGRHGVRALRPGRSPARRQNAPSASRFMATLVVM
jgi:predicted acylesterase/phospholipase RssA